MPETDTPVAAAASAVETPTPSAPPVQPPPVASVTLETMTPEEVRQWRQTGGLPPVREPKPEPVTEPSETPEQEADSHRPDKDVSEAARTLRKNRAAERKAKIQAEIDDLTRQRYALIEENTRLLRERQAAPSPTPAPERRDPAALPAKPKMEDYTDHDAYLDARDEWLRASWRAEQEHARAEEARLAAERHHAEVMTTHQQRLVEARQRYADYDAVIANPELPNFPQAVLDAVVTAPNGPDLAYALGKNLERAKAIASLPPVQAVVELGKFAAALESAKSPAPKPQPIAPPPPTTLGGKPAVPADALYAAAVDGDMTRYRAERNAQQRAAGRNW